MFINRIFSIYKKQHFFTLKNMTKIGTFYFVLLIVLYFKFFLEPFWFFIATLSALFVFPIIILVVVKFHQHQFHSEFLRFLSVVILRMHRGEGFLMASHGSLESEIWKQDHLLKSLVDNVTFSQQKYGQYTGLFGQLLYEIQSEFRDVRNNQHQAIDRLCNLRKNLRDRFIFRQKSRQIWGFFLYQTGILSLIYIGIFIYIIQEVGFYEHQKVIFLSFIFYFAGLISIYFLAKGKKWAI